MLFIANIRSQVIHKYWGPNKLASRVRQFMFQVIGLATVVISEAKMSTFEQFDIILSASPSSMTQWGIDPLGPGTPRPNWGDDLRFPSDSHLLPTQDVISHLIGHGTSHLSPASCSSIVSRHYNNPKYRAHAEGEFATMSCKSDLANYPTDCPFCKWYHFR